MKLQNLLQTCVILCFAFGSYSLSATELVIQAGTYNDIHTNHDTIRINGNVTVVDTMTIAPGTRVIFNADYTLDVFHMMAIGAPGDSIYFYPDESLGDVQLGQLLVDYGYFSPCSIPGQCKTSHMQYCVFNSLKMARSGIPINSYIKHCMWADLYYPTNCLMEHNDSIKLVMGVKECIRRWPKWS